MQSVESEKRVKACPLRMMKRALFYGTKPRNEKPRSWSPACSPESFLNCCGSVAPSGAETFHRCHSEEELELECHLNDDHFQDASVQDASVIFWSPSFFTFPLKSQVALWMVLRRNSATASVKNRNFSFPQMHRHRLTTRNGQNMRVFRRYMNVHCARQSADTIYCANGAALAAKWEILPQDSRVNKLSGKYMFKTAR